MKSLLAAFLLTSSVCMAKDISVRVGMWYGNGGLAGFYVNKNDGNREANMLVTDEHRINKVYIRASEIDLVQLRNMIDKTIAEMNK